MSLAEAIILGVVQGLTEFLPISSSGHLVIVKGVLDVDSAGIVMEVALHFGTMIAVCTFFRKDIAAIIRDVISSIRKLLDGAGLQRALSEDKNTVLFLMIVIATVPTVAIALLFRGLFEKAFDLPLLASVMIIVTGIVLWFTKSIRARGAARKTFRIVDALTVGTVQGMSIIPGVSRSGSTIAAATFLGIDAELSARFSFLLSIPVIIGAAISKSGELNGAAVVPLHIISGAVVAAIVGYLALFFLINLIKKGKLHLFSYYCWGVGLFSVIYFLG